MNITITQDNSRVEQLGSKSASIVEKLYELATNPNNTLTLEGNISGNSAYADQVTYLTTNYPDLIINANKLYITFRDPHVASALLAQGVGDGTGITMSDLDGLCMDGEGGTGKITFRGNTDIEYFEEFKYFTNLLGGNNGPLGNCTNLKLVGFSTDYLCGGDSYFENVYCDIVIPSLKWYLEYNVGRRWRFPATGDWNINVLDWHDIYIGNTNNKLENPVVTSDINVSFYARLNYTKIKTLTWESNSNIPDSFCNLCKKLTSVAITGQNIEIGDEAFLECTSLLNITGLSSVIKIHDKSFRLCTNLSADTSQLSNVTSIGSRAFEGCSNITGSLNCSNLTIINDYAFNECSNISSINLPNITAIGKDAFSGCSSLTSVKIGPSVNKLTYRALAGMPAQPNTVLYLPLITTSAESELQSISDSHYSAGCFSYNTFGEYGNQNYTNSVWGLIYLPNLTHPSGGWCAHPNYSAPLSSIDADLIYLKNISSLGVGMFGGSRLKALVINSTTPPPLTRSDLQNWDSFTRLMQADGIYVPDGYESAYTTAWANVNPPESFESSTLTYIDVLSKIKPMSLLSRYATELAWITAGRPVALIEEYMS